MIWQAKLNVLRYSLMTYSVHQFITLHQKKPKVTYKIHLCVIYICSQPSRNSSIAQLDIFSTSLADIVLKHPADKFVVFGDLNQPNIDWQSAADGDYLCPVTSFKVPFRPLFAY